MKNRKYIKNIYVLILLLAVLCVCGCGKKVDDSGDEIVSTEVEELSDDICVDDESQNDIITDDADLGDKDLKEDAEVEEANKKLLISVTGMDEDDTFTFMHRFKQFNMGRIQSMNLDSEGPDKFIDVIAEDGANYRIYIMSGMSAGSIKNLDTGEWLVTVIR